MLLKYKKIYQTSEEEVECTSRYLVNVTASPNASGSCTSITVSFNFTASPEDPPELLNWTIDNTGEIMNINACILLDTLTYNCASRVDFVWDDEIDCCP